MSSKKKKESLSQRFLKWLRGEHRPGPTLADVALGMARVEWNLLQLKLAVRKVHFLIAQDKKRWNRIREAYRKGRA